MTRHSSLPLPPDNAADRPARSPWRRRCLWLLTLLLPLTAGVLSYNSVLRWLDSQHLIARQVAAETSAQFGDASWQLDAMRAVDLPPSSGLPSDAMAVVAEFSVQVQRADLPVLWQACRIELVDDRGRRWEPSPILHIADSAARDCISAAVSGARAGSRLQVREVFLVPRAVAHAVTATVSVEAERPYYLSFTRPQA